MSDPLRPRAIARSQCSLSALSRTSKGFLRYSFSIVRIVSMQKRRCRNTRRRALVRGSAHASISSTPSSVRCPNLFGSAPVRSARSVTTSGWARRSGWREEHGQNRGVGLEPDRHRVDAGSAQDIAGIEDCTKTSGLDKGTRCLQSNVNFLHRLVTKNARDAGHKLEVAAAEIIALKGVVTRLQKTVEQLEAAQKAAGDKKPGTK